MTASNILVTGATGTVGSLLIPALRARGANVRAMVRDASRAPAGTEPAVADLRDPESVTVALRGVDTAFLNSPSTEDAAEIQKRFATIAAQQGVRHLVVLSQFAAQPDSPVRFLRWHAEVETHVAALDLEGTILRPNLFLQGLSLLAEPIKRGTLPAPIGDARVSAIDARDIADAAAVVLTTSGHAARTYTLTGPRAVTHAEIAGEITSATGHEVAFVDTAPRDFAAMAEPFMPVWQLEGLLEDYAHYTRGEAMVVTSDVADLTGHPARDATTFAIDYAAAFTPDGASVPGREAAAHTSSTAAASPSPHNGG